MDAAQRGSRRQAAPQHNISAGIRRMTGPHDSEARSPLRVTNVVFWLHRPIGFAPDKLPACGYGAMALSAITGRRQTELGSRPTNDIGMLVMLAAASRFGPGACVRPAQRAPIFRLLLLPSKPIGSSNNTAKRPGLSKTVWTSRFSPGRSGKRELESGRCRDSCCSDGRRRARDALP